MAENEYISREAAYPLAKKICDAIDSEDFKRLNFGMRILDWIDDLPAADVRPVVLCKECKHRPAKKYGRIIAPKDADGYTDYNCPFVCDDSWYNRMPADDDYCSCGEKREESADGLL